MEASPAGTDSSTGKALHATDSGTFLPNNHTGRVSSHPAQTLNGSPTMNCSGSAGSADGSAVTGVSGGGGSSAAVSPGLAKALPAPTVIQSPESAAAVPPPQSQPTVALTRPPAGSGATLNGSTTASPPGQTGACAPARLVNHGQTRPHIIKAEPPATILPPRAPPSGPPGAPQPPAMPAAGAGGVRALTSQILAPRLPHTPPGQPSVHNIQLPPGMVLVRSENGQLLMIPQQALAQMQVQAQGGLAARASTPTNLPPGQAPGNTIIGRQASPGAMIRPGCPAPGPLAAAPALHRPPVLQSSVGAMVPGVTPRTLSQTAGTTITSVTVSKETMENVKKCKNFLSTLIKLASSGKQSSETAAVVRELVKDLLEGKLEAEEFTSRLYKELSSSPQPYLVPFLKRSLPALRQLTPDSAAFIQQSQLPAAAPGPVSSPVSSPSPTPTTVVLSSPARLSAAVSRPGLQPQPQLQPAGNKPAQTTPMVLQAQQQQRAMLRPQVTSAPMMALRPQAPGPGPGRIVLGPQQLLQPAVLYVSVLVPSRPQGSAFAALTPAQRIKLKEAGGTFKDDDDINDVASMAGVNLSEESANILATNSGLVGAVTHSCKDEPFLSCTMLHRRMLEIGRRYGVTELGAEVVNYVSHATEQRLQNLLEKVSLVSQQKNINPKEDDDHEQTSDVRAQLKFFEQLEVLEKQRKEEQEREILLKAAKSRARQEDPEQLRLKQKAKEMQQQELALMRQREANLTALAAIGPRKKRKNVDSPSSSASAEGSGSGSSVAGGSGSSGSRTARQRITRVNLRDLLFCLEDERFTSRSHFLYKGFLK
ncbi:transcription initiation factor TFIID subunit 4-like [Cololabis saira]|uniref:transcription initiation factor TFIID subunit 4-like n=1 Tax=Cololabis saira TaxID=129043 RepID=UPI002AD2DB98|nr:transcription initiation factor TFIID subunit 4-like [Cololabis saira]